MNDTRSISETSAAPIGAPEPRQRKRTPPESAVSPPQNSVLVKTDVEHPPSKWLEDHRFQTVLRAIHAIAFEYDIQSGRQFVSPFIGEFLAGNYNGRLLSDVMLEDQVVHPDDIPLSVQFRQKVRQGGSGEMTLRLRTPAGEYQWYKMSLTSCKLSQQEVYVGVLADVDAEVRQRALLRFRAENDSVSGIYNKDTFFESTLRLLSAEPEKPHFLVRFDIDRFKIINQMYSVSEGDRVLHYLGEILRELVYPGETYGRIGNDVFSMCLNRTEKETILLIEQLEQRINQYPIAFQFVLSAGIVRLGHYDGEPIDILCDRAAMAQRTVKGNYLKHCAFYEKYMSDELNREHYITGCMCRALEEGQFQIFLQPKFHIQENRIVGAEVLARWKHPIDGMIPPGDFIPLFERNGFILRLDEYIWEQACKAMRAWLDRGLELVPISVNVSRIHLHDPAFCNKVLTLSQKYGIPPQLIELEITESAYTDCPQTLYGIMDQLQEMGFLFSMDDFGSGYSSLNVLKDIPVDMVKIDLNFLQKARRGEKAGREILKGTIQLVHGMGLPVIAEGVETQEQANFLISIGCTCAQGYYYAKPMPPEEFEKLLSPKPAGKDEATEPIA